MIFLAIAFFILAVVLGIFVFKKGPKTSSSQIVKTFFYIFVVLFVVMLALILAQVFFHPKVDVNLKGFSSPFKP